jgi:hypothetical protein
MKGVRRPALRSAVVTVQPNHSCHLNCLVLSIIRLVGARRRQRRPPHPRPARRLMTQLISRNARSMSVIARVKQHAELADGQPAS